jgi:vanillate O-demethylase ferredoxin subunit
MAYVEEVQRMGQSSVMLHEQVKQGLPNLSALFDAQPDGTEVFVCGPGAMIEAVRRAAREHGWADDRVHFEAFNAAHRPEDTDLTIRLRDGRQIRVGAGTTILDALDEAGIETLSDCRRGECGLCGTKVLSGGDLIDHRDSFLSPDEKATGEQMCICVSRTKPGAMLTLDVE